MVIRLNLRVSPGEEILLEREEITPDHISADKPILSLYSNSGTTKDVPFYLRTHVKSHLILLNNALTL